MKKCSNHYLSIHYNPGQKYMVHLENLLYFHHRPLFDDESSSFFQTWPSPIQMLLQGGHFECTDPTLYGEGGGGGGGGGGENGAIVKKGKVYHDFWPRIVVWKYRSNE